MNKVVQQTIDLLAYFVTGMLLLFTLRRWLFTIAALRTGPKSKESDAGSVIPPVLLLVPFRNEAETLPGLLSALENLAYPAEQLTIALIDDGSTDGSNALLPPWLTRQDNRHLVRLAENMGKAQALNIALNRFPQPEIIAIYDADERPRPSALRRLVYHFRDARIGAVSGRRAVSNSLAGPAAGYTTFEGLVHQLITLQAKDSLNLAPPLLGSNCAYRRAALNQVGAFKPGALLEDTDLTVKLAQAGWSIRFEPEAVSYHRVPETITGYWKQHTRWARGFNEVAKDEAGSLVSNPNLSWGLRLELMIFAAGYLDRLALLAGVGLALLKNRLAAATVVLSLLTPFVQVVAALKIAQAPPALWRRLLWLPLFFLVDIAMAVVGMWNTVSRLPQVWEARQTRQ